MPIQTLDYFLTSFYVSQNWDLVETVLFFHFRIFVHNNVGDDLDPKEY